MSSVSLTVQETVTLPPSKQAGLARISENGLEVLRRRYLRKGLDGKPAETVQELNWLAAATFRVTGCFDVGRIDFRLDARDNNKPYILEINPLPGLNPGYSDLPLEAQADGWTFEQLVNRILEEAVDRYGLNEADN